MGKQNDTISQYLALTKKIQALEQTLTEKESELRRKYTADFSQIKKSLRGYMTKIRPTVEMVCDLYRLKVRFSGERIHTQEGVPTMDYDACTACEEAIRQTACPLRFLMWTFFPKAARRSLLPNCIGSYTRQ